MQWVIEREKIALEERIKMTELVAGAQYMERKQSLEFENLSNSVGRSCKIKTSDENIRTPQVQSLIMHKWL